MCSTLVVLDASQCGWVILWICFRAIIKVPLSYNSNNCMHIYICTIQVWAYLEKSQSITDARWLYLISIKFKCCKSSVCFPLDDKNGSNRTLTFDDYIHLHSRQFQVQLTVSSSCICTHRAEARGRHGLNLNVNSHCNTAAALMMNLSTALCTTNKSPW